MDKIKDKKIENKKDDEKSNKSSSPKSKTGNKEIASNKIIKKGEKINSKNNKVNNENKKEIKPEEKSITSSLEISSKNTTLNKLNETISKEDKKTTFSEPKNKKNKKKIENKIILNDIDSEILKNINNIPNYSNRSFDISTIRNMNTTSLNNSLNKSISKVMKTNVSIIEDEKYRNTLNDIYNKRKEKFSPDKNKEKNIKNQTYERSINYMKRKQEKIKNLIKLNEDKEIEECTFKPKYYKNKYNKLQKRSNTTTNKERINDFYQKEIKWKNDLKNKNQLIEKDLLDKMNECTFYPKTTKDIHEKVLMESKMKNEPDFIYKKNIEWLDKIKKNRIKSEKEIINQFKSEQNELRENCKKDYKKITGKKMDVNKNNIITISNLNKEEKKEIDFDEINSLIKEFKIIIENNKKFMNENDFNFKKYNKKPKTKKLKDNNYLEGSLKYQNDYNSNKQKKYIIKRETDEEMNNKYELLMAKYLKEKNQIK